ncbi:hypothetical protein [Asaia astilbis]|uniref:hypothetical protein n=1 Tax=Asaia astilbis TaxID=610244 RepID=UPI0004719300|nr:hypothetical protein [Asaia astilbis]
MKTKNKIVIMLSSGAFLGMACASAQSNQYVTQDQINQPNGVAGLDASGAISAAVKANKVQGTQSVDAGDMPASPKWAWTGWAEDAGHMAGPRITLETPHVDMNAQVADHMASFGGHQLYDSVFTKFYALPYGVGDKGGCVQSVAMTLDPGTGVNCGAGGWDAVTQYVLATNNPPWYMTGAEIPDETGKTHAVTLTANGAIVRPALPKSYLQQMHADMHVITNIVAGPPIFTGPSLSGVNTHRDQNQQFYGNTYRSSQSGTDAKGSFTRFDMAGQWQPFNGSPPVPNGHVPSPGSASNNGRTDALDKVIYGQLKSTSLFFGVYMKHFTRNTTCLVNGNPGADGPGSAAFGPSRKCDEELDNWYYGPDYGATMHGLTIGLAGNVPSDDSYGLAVAGGWPQGVRVSLGSNGIDFDGDEYVTGSRMGPTPAVGVRKPLAEWWQEPSKDVGYLESVKLWTQVDGVNDKHNGVTQADAAAAADISYWFGPRQSASRYNVDGVFESAITFNPAWSKNGVALCGLNADRFQGSDLAGTACFTVDSWGDASTSGTITANNGAVVKGSISVSGGGTFGGNLDVNNGRSVVLQPSATGAASLLAYGDVSPVQKAPMLRITNSKGGWSYLRVDAVIGTLDTPPSSSASCEPGRSEDDQNYHYVCTSPNHWRRVALQDF